VQWLQVFERISQKNQMNKYMSASAEVVNRVIKYLVEGLFVALAALFIPKKQLVVEDIIALGIVAAAVFAILDVVSPSIGSSARGGAGFGIGANLVGFPMRG